MSTSVVAKAIGYWDGSTIVLAAADDAVPAQLITLILLTNWCYTKMAKQKITDIKRLQQANIYTTKIFMEFEMIVFHVFGSVYLQLIYP